MAMDMCKPKRIHDVSVTDLQNSRWCYYHNDEEGYDCFEHVIPDTHPGFTGDTEEFELAEFTFSNGKTVLGSFDGSKSFNIAYSNSWFSFWYGVSEPKKCDIAVMTEFLSSNGYELPVKARAKWSNKTKVFNGLQYINDNGDIIEIAI